VFVDTFKSELSKSRELQETVKALQDESGKIGDSEALRRAKEAYAKARVPHYPLVMTWELTAYLGTK
jgi:import inner membrane translocase subunit TIM44